MLEWTVRAYLVRTIRDLREFVVNAGEAPTGPSDFVEQAFIPFGFDDTAACSPVKTSIAVLLPAA